MGFDVKITTKISILDLIMPYTCRGCGCLGELLCGRCKKYIMAPEVRDGWIYAVGRREGVLMQLTEDYKYKAIRKTALVLAELMDTALPKELEGSEVIIVPLPTILSHIRERGFDHTLKLAKVLAKRRGYEVNSLLIRANKTIQVGSNAATRKKQAEEAYELAPGARLEANKTYLLLDDISTTGASLRAARKILCQAGAQKIYGVVVCLGLND